jgi:hypothetical protein
MHNSLCGTLHLDPSWPLGCWPTTVLAAASFKLYSCILLLSYCRLLESLPSGVAQAAHECRPHPVGAATDTGTSGQCPSHTEHFFRPGVSVASLFHLLGLSHATESPLTKQFAVQLALPTQNKPIEPLFRVAI